jgi:hypothetical protein
MKRYRKKVKMYCCISEDVLLHMPRPPFRLSKLLSLLQEV